MFFILQNEPVGRDPVQNAIIQDVLDHNKYSHSYEYVSIMDFYKDDTDEDLSLDDNKSRTTFLTL